MKSLFVCLPVLLPYRLSSNVCSLLSEKVYFLTGSGDEKHQDVRGMSFSASVDFAVSAKLDGIVTSSTPLKGNLGQVEEAVKRGIKVMTYGSLKYLIYLFVCLLIQYRYYSRCCFLCIFAFTLKDYSWFLIL